MVSRGERELSRDEGAVNFAGALETLKERGSGLLVVGPLPQEVYVRASTQMLGDPHATPPRRRLVAALAGSRDRDVDRLEQTGPLCDEWARLVSYDADCRSAAVAHSSAAGSPDRLETVRVDGSVVELGDALSDAIADFDRASGGLDPAELRVAFDCLPALLAEYGTEAAFRFCHVLTTQIRLAHGMGHFWLPKERTEKTVRQFEPLFDAVIELELDDGGLKQRWHFRDVPLVTDWLSLEP